MKRKKIMLAIAIIATVIVIIATVIFAICYCVNTYGRLLLIRATMYVDLPDWLKMWLWGWR